MNDIDIARDAKPAPIENVADALGIPSDALNRYGQDKAKIRSDFIRSTAERPDGRLVLVTAISPTPAGEGKTTTTVGLGDALNRIGRRAAICLREPSLGPCFGMKGGAAGGGYSQVIPMEDINLHFTGDFHAITSAHNLLAAMLDNHVYWGNKRGIDVRRVLWRRVVDMNDRALRDVVCSLGGVANGFPRQSGYDITVASEVMAILCLASDLEDLRRRLGNIVVAYDGDRNPVTASDLKADGAMTVLLKDALMPNLAQTLENNPALVHGGPFANIAHGCNSAIATRLSLKLSDYTVTEAGFGADLGAEKFFDIKCRKAGLKPDAAVLVATIRALRHHGGVEKSELGTPNLSAVEKGLANIGRHVRNVGRFGVPLVVAVNVFSGDSDAEIEAVSEYVKSLGVETVRCSHWAEGGAGAERLAEAAVELAESGRSQFRTLYDDDMSLLEKARSVAQEIYHADDVIADKSVRAQLARFEELGYGHFPVCMAKTQYSFSTDPNLRGAPLHHVVPIREVRLSAGAEFVVCVCGDIMTMPGLPSSPAAEAISLDDNGYVVGLF